MCFTEPRQRGRSVDRRRKRGDLTTVANYLKV
jgi:hypothetical protein